jgi:hypothetical protein
MRIFVIVASALVLAATSAGAQQPAPPIAPQERVICKRQIDADTGSHFSSSRRVCMKASDWKQLDDETQRALTAASNGGRVSAVPNQGMGGSPQ